MGCVLSNRFNVFFFNGIKIGISSIMGSSDNGLCHKTVSFSFLWNGNSLIHFVPTRGIRQGCPLSSYLVLFVADDFSSSLRFAEVSDLLFGIQLSRYAPPISHHLCRVDDSSSYSLLLNDNQDTIEVFHNPISFSEFWRSMNIY